MNLIRIGGVIELAGGRWEDLLDRFELVYCVNLMNGERIQDERASLKDEIVYFEFNCSFWTKLFIGIEERCSKFESLSFVCQLLIILLRFSNRNLLKKLSTINYDKAISGFCDYDMSDLLTLIIKPIITKPIIRSYKESRPGFDFNEKECFLQSDIISLSDEEALHFFENKYGSEIFHGKKILLGGDENVLPSKIINSISYRQKLSQKDGKIHAVILAGRVFSSYDDLRSGARLFYINVIKELMRVGMVVHLHTLRIINDEKGINQYKRLQEESNGSFVIEKPLDFDGYCQEACEEISKYDIGILHNFIEGTAVSEFDMVNVPHRFYEYEAAHVLPIIEAGRNKTLESIFRKYNCGIIYSKLDDITKINLHDFQYYTPSYMDFINNVIMGGEMP